MAHPQAHPGRDLAHAQRRQDGKVRRAQASARLQHSLAQARLLSAGPHEYGLVPGLDVNLRALAPDQFLGNHPRRPHR